MKKSIYGISNLSLLCITTLFLSGCGATSNMRFRGEPEAPICMNKDKISVKPITPDTIQSLRINHVKVYPELQIRSSVPAYRIKSGDVILVTVWDRPDLNNPMGGAVVNDPRPGQVVDYQGEIYYPYVGRIKIVGLTVPEFRTMLTKKLSKYVKEPQVDIKIIDYRGQQIYVQGAVATPGAKRLDDLAMTIGEAINRSGGFKADADLSQVALWRDGKVYMLDLVQAFEARGINNFEIQLEPGDYLKVAFQSENKIYILGGVDSKGSISVGSRRVSLRDALGQSDIHPQDGDATRVYVLRQEEEGKICLYHLDASNPISLVWADQFELKARDIVYVDRSGIYEANRIISLLMPTISVIHQGIHTAKMINDTRKSLGIK